MSNKCQMETASYKNKWDAGNYKYRFVWLLFWRLVTILLPFRCGRSYACRMWLFRKFGGKHGYWANIMPGAKVRDPRNLEVGAYSSIAPGVNVYNAAKVTIGQNCVISQGAMLCTATHDVRRRDFALICRPITIGNGVWIAMDAFVLPGVTIGDGAVVGARTVVTKDVEPYSIVVGNPARVVGKREIAEIEE